MVYSVRVLRYLRNAPAKSQGIRGQTPHWDFSRSLTDLLHPAFEAGLVLDGIEERAYPASEAERHRFSWRNYQDIPPLLVVRLRNP
jgi:hypothetical protein